MPKTAAKPEGDTRFNLAALRKSGFADAPRAHLLKAYALLAGDEADEHQSDDELAAECRRLTGTTTDVPRGTSEPPAGIEEPTQQQLSAQVVSVGKLGSIPRLGPETLPAWDGRKRLVDIAALPGEQDTITLGWDARSKWTIKLPVQDLEMPWPFWECLKNAVYVDDRSVAARKHLRDEETGKAYVITKVIRRPLYPYHDRGDVPGTEDLPTSYWDWAQGESLRTRVWRNYPRPALMRIYRLIRDDPGSAFFERKTNVDIRVAIATILGPQHLAVMDAEIYDDGSGEATA